MDEPVLKKYLKLETAPINLYEILKRLRSNLNEAFSLIWNLKSEI